MNESINHDIRFIKIRGVEGGLVKRWYIRDLTLNKDLPYTFDTPAAAIKKSNQLDRMAIK